MQTNPLKNSIQTNYFPISPSIPTTLYSLAYASFFRHSPAKQVPVSSFWQTHHPVHPTNPSISEGPGTRLSLPSFPLALSITSQSPVQYTRLSRKTTPSSGLFVPGFVADLRWCAAIWLFPWRAPLRIRWLFRRSSFSSFCRASLHYFGACHRCIPV